MKKSEILKYLEELVNSQRIESDYDELYFGIRQILDNCR